MVWADPRSLATTNGIDSLSFPAVTEIFHFTAFDFTGAMYSHQNDLGYPRPGFPIRKSSD